MAKLKDRELIEIIPSLFRINLKSDKDGKTVFEKLKEVFDFDYGYIYYLNPDTVQLKYSNVNRDLINSVYNMSKKDLNFLYSQEGGIFTPKSSLIKSLNFGVNLICSINLQSDTRSLVFWYCVQKKKTYTPKTTLKYLKPATLSFHTL